METSRIDPKLLKRAKSGDDQALSQIYLDNKKLIYSLMKRYHYSNDERDDIVSVASIGLIKAIQNYDPSYNLMFSTYAVPLVLGEIRRYFREKSLLKVSRKLKDIASQVLAFQNEFRQKEGREGTIEEVSEALDIPIENVMLAIESSYQPSSIEEPLLEDYTLMDTLGEDNSELVGKYLDLDMALSCLEPKERLFIHFRYYLNLTQQEIASRLFTNQVAVSRLERKVLKKMRERLLAKN